MTPMTTSDRRRRARHMLPGSAVQLVTVRYLGIFLSDPLEVSAGGHRLCGRAAGHRGPSCVGRWLAVPGLDERGGQKQPPCAVT